MKLPDKVYDILKWVCLILMPALAWGYSELAAIWPLPYPEQIPKTINIVAFVLGVLIGVSTINYNKQNPEVQFMTFSQEFTTFVSICSGIAVIIGCIKLLNTPLDDIRKNKLEIENLKKEQLTRKAMDKAILNSLQAITNHMIDGNGIEDLKKSRTELNQTINDIATH